ncbi:MAG: NAD(P)/FAD-dependent oxidoreductase [Phyllobacterium sp.]|uniref:NAD(P)/FAD-dependent oxidoreductase n=1 Tax=Phyllobacterium sp. TaxID=1871046 RepID=UPI0030EFCECF
MTYDAIIIGGSFAGLSAALQLARARRSILIIDDGLRRNRFAAHSHGFLTQDGRPPSEIIASARSQLMRYDAVDWLDARAEMARRADKDEFHVIVKGESERVARRLILSTGVTDILPQLPGLKERWGRTVFHCPYCHGYELERGKIAVLATSSLSMHHALMLPDWGETTLLLNGSFEPDAGQLYQLAQRGVTVERCGIERLDGGDEQVDVILNDGRILKMDGLFTLPKTVIPVAFARQLGCTLDEGPLGNYLYTDATKATTVNGVFACGDVARAAGSVAMAVGDGAMAGVAAHRSLLFG